MKRILNAKKAKISDKQSGKTEKPPAKSEKASVRAEKGKQICCQRHPATNLLSQANIRMPSHGLRQFVDVKSVTSCQQTCCKLIVKTCYP